MLHIQKLYTALKLWILSVKGDTEHFVFLGIIE